MGKLENHRLKSTFGRGFVIVPWQINILNPQIFWRFGSDDFRSSISKWIFKFQPLTFQGVISDKVYSAAHVDRVFVRVVTNHFP